MSAEIAAPDPRVLEAIRRAIELVNEGRPADDQLDGALDTVLFGEGGRLDSLELVELIAETEAILADEHGIVVVLASEQALSRKRSPFRTAGTLAEFASGLLADAAR